MSETIGPTPDYPQDISPRNSPLRKLSFVRGFTDKTAELIVQHTPLSPDHITYLGVGLVGLGSLALGASTIDSLDQYSDALQAVGLSGLGLGTVLDAIDGPVARKTPDHDFDRGQVVDAVSDRAMDTVMAASRWGIAYASGSELAQVAALAAWVTNYLPSLERAHAEQNGAVGREFDIGSRPVRVLSNFVGLGAGALGYINIMAGVDISSAAANTITAIKRRNLAQEAEESGKREALEREYEGVENSPVIKQINQADRRYRALSMTTKAGLATGAAAALGSLLK